jgi:hypothetical protein
MSCTLSCVLLVSVFAWAAKPTLAPWSLLWPWCREIRTCYGCGKRSSAGSFLLFRSVYANSRYAVAQLPEAPTPSCSWEAARQPQWASRTAGLCLVHFARVALPGRMKLSGQLSLAKRRVLFGCLGLSWEAKVPKSVTMARLTVCEFVHSLCLCHCCITQSFLLKHLLLPL